MADRDHITIYQPDSPLLVTSEPVKFRPVNRCIYCGAFSNHLGKEHIVPFGLAGDALVLPKASCRSCESITSKVERFLLRTILGPFRIKIGAPTRRPGERPAALKVEIGFTDNPNTTQPITVQSLDLPVEDYPLIFCGLRLRPPGIITGRTPDNTLDGELWLRHDSSIVQKFNLTNGKSVKIGTMQPEIFMRALSKIGYSYAVAKLGYGNFVPLVTPYILEKAHTGCHWVGGDYTIPAATPHLHSLTVGQHHIDGHRYVVSSVRLFPFFATPQYHVVVGELQDGQDGRPLQ